MRFVARTIANPTKQLSSFISQNATSRLVVGTPKHAEEIMDHMEKSPIQTVAITVDGVPFGSQTGFSILEMTEPMLLSDQQKIVQGSNRPTHYTTSRESWTLDKGHVSFSWQNSSRVVVPTANTQFATGTQSAMAFNDPTLPLNRTLLSSLHIGLPLELKKQQSSAPLTKITDDFTITSFKDNLIKTLDDRPAASILEEMPVLQRGDTDAQRNRKVFATVHNAQGKFHRHEVTAGGGGSWSPRASMLVLESEARFEPGDKLYFSMHEPTTDNRRQVGEAIAQYEKYSQQFILESKPIYESVHDQLPVTYPSDTIIPSFGLASESGYLVDNVKHAVEGELVSLEMH